MKVETVEMLTSPPPYFEATSAGPEPASRFSSSPNLARLAWFTPIPSRAERPDVKCLLTKVCNWAVLWEPTL